MKHSIENILKKKNLTSSSHVIKKTIKKPTKREKTFSYSKLFETHAVQINQCLIQSFYEDYSKFLYSKQVTPKLKSAAQIISKLNYFDKNNLNGDKNSPDSDKNNPCSNQSKSVANSEKKLKKIPPKPQSIPKTPIATSKKLPKVKTSPKNEKYSKILNIGFVKTQQNRVIYSCFIDSCRFKSFDAKNFENHLISFHQNEKNMKTGNCLICENFECENSPLDELFHLIQHIEGNHDEIKSSNGISEEILNINEKIIEKEIVLIDNEKIFTENEKVLIQNGAILIRNEINLNENEDLMERDEILRKKLQDLSENLSNTTNLDAKIQSDRNLTRESEVFANYIEECADMPKKEEKWNNSHEKVNSFSDSDDLASNFDNFDKFFITEIKNEIIHHECIEDDKESSKSGDKPLKIDKKSSDNKKESSLSEKLSCLHDNKSAKNEPMSTINEKTSIKNEKISCKNEKISSETNKIPSKRGRKPKKAKENPKIHAQNEETIKNLENSANDESLLKIKIKISGEVAEIIKKESQPLHTADLIKNDEIIESELKITEFSERKTYKLPDNQIIRSSVDPNTFPTMTMNCLFFTHEQAMELTNGCTYESLLEEMRIEKEEKLELERKYWEQERRKEERLNKVKETKRGRKKRGAKKGKNNNNQKTGKVQGKSVKKEMVQNEKIKMEKIENQEIKKKTENYQNNIKVESEKVQAIRKSMRNVKNHKKSDETIESMVQNSLKIIKLEIHEKSLDENLEKCIKVEKDEIQRAKHQISNIKHQEDAKYLEQNLHQKSKNHDEIYENIETNLKILFDEAESSDLPIDSNNSINIIDSVDSIDSNKLIDPINSIKSENYIKSSQLDDTKPLKNKSTRIQSKDHKKSFGNSSKSDGKIEKFSNNFMTEFPKNSQNRNWEIIRKVYATVPQGKIPMNSSVKKEIISSKNHEVIKRIGNKSNHKEQESNSRDISNRTIAQNSKELIKLEKNHRAKEIQSLRQKKIET